MNRRLASIDMLRGFVMVLMALDHVREAWTEATFDPTDLSKTNAALFATRWITHLCAPTFVFLAGTGAALSLTRGKTRRQLSWFLFTRGVWIVVLELTVVKFGFENVGFWTWWTYRLQVMWALGMSMIILAGLIHLPMPAIVAFGATLVIGHDAFDGVSPASLGSLGWMWHVLHVSGDIPVGDVHVYVAYPLIPWVGVMALGYALGRYLATSRSMDEPRLRARLFAIGGGVLLVVFVALRASNLYGDLHDWSGRDSAVMSFFNVWKYPPSLLYLCATLGIAGLLLAAFERWRVPLGNVFQMFGRVPLFFYVLHLPLITTSANLAYRVATGEWPSAMAVELVPWGVSLPIVYAVWLVLVAVLYFACRWFAGVKERRRDWWLGYL